jgi:hypothetical protein
VESIRYNSNWISESPSYISITGIRKVTVRVWLETAIPPVFGKEMDKFNGRYLEHGDRLFYLTVKRQDERIFQGTDPR